MQRGLRSFYKHYQFIVSHNWHVFVGCDWLYLFVILHDHERQFALLEIQTRDLWPTAVSKRQEGQIKEKTRREKTDTGSNNETAVGFPLKAFN